LAVSIAYLTVYAFLFVLLGVTSHIILFVLTPTT